MTWKVPACAGVRVTSFDERPRAERGDRVPL